MPHSLQYPLELDRRLLRKWERLRTATPIKGAAIDAILLAGATVPVACALVGTMPPRGPKKDNDNDNDDEDEDDDDDDEEADEEPAVIREPDRDE